MQLSLQQIATRLGKSERQVIYMIQQGRLPAQKIGGRWFMDSDDLPQNDNKRQAQQRKNQKLKKTVEKTLNLDGEDAARYSVLDLRAFQIALPVYRRAHQELGESHLATLALHRVLDHLCRGYHRYAKPDKTESYRNARDEASTALCELVLADSPAASALIETLEQDLMGSLGGLLRQMDKTYTNKTKP
jgi:hypothetical protein